MWLCLLFSSTNYQPTWWDDYPNPKKTTAVGKKPSPIEPLASYSMAHVAWHDTVCHRKNIYIFWWHNPDIDARKYPLKWSLFPGSETLNKWCPVFRQRNSHVIWLDTWRGKGSQNPPKPWLPPKSPVFMDVNGSKNSRNDGGTRFWLIP